MENQVKNSEEITISLQEYNSLKEHCSELETQVKWLMEGLEVEQKTMILPAEKAAMY